MTLVSSISRGSFALVFSALIIASAILVSTFYRATGDSHDAVYYACLYAGSLSQVSTAPPANCGRGKEVSWISHDATHPPTRTIGGTVFNGEVSYGSGFTVEELSATTWRINFPAGTWNSAIGFAPVVTHWGPGFPAVAILTIDFFPDGSGNFIVVFEETPYAFTFVASGALE